MSDLSTLDNFPFSTMEDLSQNFNEGKAEPVIPKDFAREWATKDSQSSSKFPVALFNTIIPFVSIGLIIYLTNKSDFLKWYHALSALLICFFAFNRQTSKSFRFLSILLVIAATVYLYVTGNAFYQLIALTFGLLISLQLADYFALKDIVNKILADRNLVKRLWEVGALGIRYKDGVVVFKDKKMNLGK